MRNDRQEFHLHTLLSSFAEQMRSSLSQNLIPHPGELGTGREEVIREFLRQYLPSQFGVSDGFVFDYKGEVSKQIDIVIYDAQLCPRFKAAGGKNFFPCESVVAVGQVKSSLTSARTFAEVAANLQSVKMLDRSAGGKNASETDGHILNQWELHLDQVFTFVFVVGRSLSRGTVCKLLASHTKATDRHLWPNLYFAFDRFLVTYFCPDGSCPNPLHALGISTSTSECSPDHALLRFYKLVARATAATHVTSFPYWEYLEGREALETNYEPFQDE